MATLDVFMKGAELLPRDALDDVADRPGTHLYAIASCPRKRVRATGGTSFTVESRMPNEEWQPEANVGFRKLSVSCEPPWTSVTLRGPTGERREDVVLWWIAFLEAQRRGGAVLPPQPFEWHYVGRAFGDEGHKVAKERLAEGHQALEKVASHLLHDRPERVLYLLLLEPQFLTGEVDAYTGFTPVQEVPATAQLVDVAEGALIEWASPCLASAKPCGLCFNSRRENKALDQALEKYQEVAVGGLPRSYLFASPHRAWPTLADALVVCKQ